ncbi:MAG: SirB1 family protein [Pseudomonadota bacterium]
MNQQDIRQRFAELASLAASEVPLDEAALLIAAETDEPFDIAGSLAALDRMAERFETVFDRTTTLGVSVASLNDFIHREEGFAGSIHNYYAPENSYLNRVIETHYGIPITLALIHITMGARLNLPVRGINFPGHFLVRYGDEKHMIVDPFTGRLLSETDCATLLKQIAGPRAVVQPEYFDPADNKSVLLRVLDNLKQIFWRNKAWDESEKCIERQLLLRPTQHEFSIQLGAVYEMQGKTLMAQHTYTRVLQITSDEQIRTLASKRLLSLESRSRVVH